MNDTVFAAEKRQQRLLELYTQYLKGHIDRGDILRLLRKQVLGMNQTEFCELVGISRRSLTSIENNEAGNNEEVLNKAFKIFGLKTGVVLTSTAQLNLLLAGRT